eukprot:TRINITY_DN10768_c0_g3_i1.p1 TRINITY_DN10768_c0_g3~~TRINITY_DN10768_c0_g3_i1.p1  ORF type:complete len:359 (-),score=61.91 TRINITY_DN10768_c0_g3_i1:55-1131(-)
MGGATSGLGPTEFCHRTAARFAEPAEIICTKHCAEDECFTASCELIGADDDNPKYRKAEILGLQTEPFEQHSAMAEAVEIEEARLKLQRDAEVLPLGGGSELSATLTTRHRLPFPDAPVRAPNDAPLRLPPHLRPHGQDGEAPSAQAPAREASSVPRGSDVDYDRAGLAAMMVAAAVTKCEDSAEAYRPLDCVYEDPTTRGKVFVGNREAASDRGLLFRLGIEYVINCQDENTENFFESDRRMTYMRFPIAQFSRSESARTDAGALTCFAPAFRFVDEILARGGRVLVHCFAGMHRAGATGVAIVMHRTGWRLQAALRHVTKLRPSVQLVLTLCDLMTQLDGALLRCRGGSHCKMVAM